MGTGLAYEALADQGPDDTVTNPYLERDILRAVNGEGAKLPQAVGRRPTTAGFSRCLKIVRILHIAGEKLRVCEFSPLLDVSDSAISRAFSQLTDAGLVTRRKDGKWGKHQTTVRADALLFALDGSRR